MTAYDSAGRFAHGVGPEPRCYDVPRDITIPARSAETTYCGNCGEPIWNDWRGALHTCKPRSTP